MSRMSREKGKRGELLFRDLCRGAGFSQTERTGWHQSFAGNAAPDCRIPELPNIWPEVKFVEKLNVRAAYRQAETAAAIGMVPTVFHKTSRGAWLVTLAAEDFLRICGQSNLVERPDDAPDSNPPGAPDR
jgi:hypothetical protein